MEDTLHKFNEQKKKKMSLNGMMGINKKPLCSYSPTEIIPGVLHVPLGLIQCLWDKHESFSKDVANLSDDYRNARFSLAYHTSSKVESLEKSKDNQQRIEELKDIQRKGKNRMKELTKGNDDWIYWNQEVDKIKKLVKEAAQQNYKKQILQSIKYNDFWCKN